MKIQSHLLILVSVIILGSCSQKTITVKKMYSYHKAGYSVKLNGKEMDPNIKFLDPNNLSRIHHSKRMRTITMIQKDTAAHYLRIDSVMKKGQSNNLHLIVINGIAFEKEKFSLIQIESTSIKSIEVLKQDSLSTFHFKGDVLLITTK